MTQRIRLEEFTRGAVRNLSGQDRGLAARAQFKLDELDESNEAVVVEVPQYLDAINSSFFQGMFSKTVHRLGSREAFLRRFSFAASPVILRQVERGLSAVLTRRHSMEAA